MEGLSNMKFIKFSHCNICPVTLRRDRLHIIEVILEFLHDAYQPSFS